MLERARYRVLSEVIEICRDLKKNSDIILKI